MIFFAWVVWIWIAVTVLVDVFRRRDLSGWGKAGWVGRDRVAVPRRADLFDQQSRGHGRSKRQEAEASQAQLDDYVRKTAGTGGPAVEIEKAKTLLDSGVITQAEFDAIKAKAIGPAVSA